MSLCSGAKQLQDSLISLSPVVYLQGLAASWDTEITFNHSFLQTKYMLMFFFFFKSGVDICFTCINGFDDCGNDGMATIITPNEGISVEGLMFIPTEFQTL